MKKILIIAYYWPPSGGAGVQRWLKFVKYLAQMDYEVHVYTTSNPETTAFDEDLLKEVPDNVTVIRKKIWEPFEVYRKFTGKKEKNTSVLFSDGKTKKRKFTESVALFVRANLFVPDAKMFWIKPSVRFLKKYVRENDIPLVVSTGPPHSLHLIAKKIKKALKIKWIADFRDPWTNIDYFDFFPTLSIVDKWHKKLEKKVLKAADKVVVVSPQMKKEFSHVIPTQKIELITNGYDSELKEKPTLNEKFTIAHVGSINVDRVHPSFYEALHELLASEKDLKKHLSLLFIGKVSYEVKALLAQHQLEECTDMPGYLSYHQLIDIQSKVHLLYLPINNTPNAKGILTGKFFEYLAARRPILAQGPQDGDLAELLNYTHAGAIFEFEDKENLKLYIKKQYDNFLQGLNDFESQHVEEFSRKSLTLKMDKLFSEFI